MEHTVAQLILLQNANGSWDMNEDLAKVLGTSLEDMKAVHPTEVKSKAYQRKWYLFLKIIFLVVKFCMNRGPLKIGEYEGDMD